MPQRGEILVERLTGKRAIVISVSGEELTCRFSDGRLEERFDFELDPVLPILNQLLTMLGSLFFSAPPRERAQMPTGERPRPLLVRPSNA